MPYAVISGKDCYKVINTQTGKVHAKCTTEDKAKAQMRLLYGVEGGMKVRGKK